MSLRVQVVNDRRAWRDFLALPRLVQGADPNWVPPLDGEVRRTLDPTRNPCFREARLGLFVAYRGSEPVARACAVASEAHFRRFGRTALFGFYEARQDPEATALLFDSVATFCRAAGAEEVAGPFNPNHYSELGLQTSGFDSAPVFFETHNPPFYGGLLESVGFEVRKRLHTRSNPDVGAYIHRRYGTTTRPSQRRSDFTVRPFRLHDMAGELDRIRVVYNDAFADNWCFLPVSAAEYAFTARYLFLVTYPRLVALVERGGEPAGVVQCALDVNPLLRRLDGRATPAGYARFLLGRHRIRDVVLFAVGIKRAFQGGEAYELLVEYLCWVLRGSRALTTTWMTDDNLPALRGAARFGLERSREFAIYGRRT